MISKNKGNKIILHANTNRRFNFFKAHLKLQLQKKYHFGLCFTHINLIQNCNISHPGEDNFEDKKNESTKNLPCLIRFLHLKFLNQF